MTEKKFELTRRRVLGGIVTIGAASAATGAGTMALFSDTEESAANSVTAGTLNLELDPGDDGYSTSVSISTAVPGDSGHIVLSLDNTGNVDGTLNAVKVGNIADGTYQSSLRIDDDGTATEFNGSDGSSGDLDTNMQVEAFIETSDDVTEPAGTSASSIASRSNNETDVFDLSLSDAVGSHTPANTVSIPAKSNEPNDSNDTKYLVFNYEIPTETGNEIQGDEVGFDIQVELEQST